MSTEEPPEEKTPPDLNRENKITARESSTDKSIQSSAAKLMEAAQEAVDTALESGATPEEANKWLALNLAKTTIQLNPNSNQLDPANVADMANKSLDIKGNRKTSEAVENVIGNA